MTDESEDSTDRNSLSGRNWKQAYTASFARRKVAFAFHDNHGNVYPSRLIRVGDVLAEDMKVNVDTLTRMIASGLEGRGEARIFIYRNVVPGIDVWASMSDIGIEWNVKVKSADAPRIFEFESTVPYNLPNAVGEIASTDAKGNWADVVVTTERTRDGDREILRTVKEFMGRVSVRDPVTRKRSWSHVVAYPVRIR